MTSPYLQGSGVVPLATRLNLRGTQTDPFGEVKGGHRALFDYSTMGGSIANGGAVDNLIVGGDDGAMLGVDSGNISTNKGIYKSSVSAFGVGLGGAFNLLSYGSEPSVVLSFWITHKDKAAANCGVIGHSYQGGTYNQWLISGNGSNIVFQSHGAYTSVAAANDTPLLHTLYFDRISAGSFRFRGFLGNTLVHTSQSSYPFRDPVGGAPSAVPVFGYVLGYSTAYKGILHRAQAVQVDPATFSISDWLAAEIAANGGRFA